MSYVTASLFISMCFIGGTYGFGGFGGCPTPFLCLGYSHCCPSFGEPYGCCNDGEFYAWIFASVVAGALFFSCCCCCCCCICCRSAGTNVSVAMTENSGPTAMYPESKMLRDDAVV